MFHYILAIWLISIFLTHSCAQQLQENTTEIAQRRLSTVDNYFTGENMKTINGKVPLTSCPIGYYRIVGTSNLIMVTGQREDGCRPCPVGRYGSTTGLTTALCTAACPAGTYNDLTGRSSLLDCQLCPVGRYGSVSGLTTADCSGYCAAGRYSTTAGNTLSSSCIACPTGYNAWQCKWAVAPRTGQIQDHGRGGPFGLKANFKDPLSQK